MQNDNSGGPEKRASEVELPLVTPLDVRRFVSEPEFRLIREQQRALLKDKSLRQFLRRECASRSSLHMPQAAAAANVERLDRRPISGGRMSLIPSNADPSIVSVVLETEKPQVWAHALMIIDNERLGVFKLALPSLDGDQVFQHELDMRDPLQNSILEALASPLSEADVVVP